MATNDSKAPAALALDRLSPLFCDLYALHDIGLRFEKCPFAATSMRMILKALGSSMGAGIDEARKLLPAKHAARPHLALADRAIQSMDDMVLAVHDSNFYSVPRKIWGSMVVDHVWTLGREIERAMVACGQEAPSDGYLVGACHDPESIGGRPWLEIEEERAAA